MDEKEKNRRKGVDAGTDLRGSTRLETALSSTLTSLTRVL